MSTTVEFRLPPKAKVQNDFLVHLPPELRIFTYVSSQSESSITKRDGVTRVEGLSHSIASVTINSFDREMWQKLNDYSASALQYIDDVTEDITGQPSPFRMARSGTPRLTKEQIAQAYTYDEQGDLTRPLDVSGFNTVTMRAVLLDWTDEQPAVIDGDPASRKKWEAWRIEFDRLVRILADRFDQEERE